MDEQGRPEGLIAGPPATSQAANQGKETPSLRIYTVAEKLALMQAYDAFDGTMDDFCAQKGVTTASLCKWRRQFRAGGEAGLEPANNPRNAAGVARAAYTVEERLAAVEGYRKSGMNLEDFGRTWGVSKQSLARWARRHQKLGKNGLVNPSTGLEPRRKAKGLSPVIKGAIADVKRQFPTFGLRKVRDFMVRFRAVKVSTGSVRKALKEAQLPTGVARQKKWQKRPVIRTFERARAGELWQSDITSFNLGRYSQRVYLVAFLDDFSRYVVSWNLCLQQTQEMVIEALLDGIQRFGKPVELLTDQGRQYVSWRGKSEFQKVLQREGIRHVVSRTHHPQTLGKTERFWETVGTEFWGRIIPRDLAEARERLGHFVSHYNHFRPHQGIGGMVPADRFFGAEGAVRKAIEGAMAGSELGKAIGEEPRKPVFLAGMIGDEVVSLHGERGKLVIQTPGGLQEMDYDGLGAGGRTAKEESDGGRGGREEGAEAEGAEQEADVAGEVPGAGEGVVGGGERGGEGACARGEHCVAGGVAGEGEEGGGGEEAGGEPLEAVAAVEAGGIGDGGGAVEAAADGAEGDGGGAGGRESGHGGDAEEAEGAGAGDEGAEGADRASAFPPVTGRAGEAEGGASGGEKKGGGACREGSAGSWGSGSGGGGGAGEVSAGSSQDISG
jgi:transposase InsO family protein/transposase-like protein